MSQEIIDEEIKERIEHRDMLLDLQAVLATPSGKNIFKYLFKNLGVAELPELGLTGDILMDKLGFLRAGNAIFRIVAEANPDVASDLLAKIEKERHAKIYADAKTRGS